ncbi:MAG: alkaline phosphatase family protein [Candidatus Riflebacteria bacterium]|nr:alkaline phosphatase family protein [Candidatus Riflebacteria bacterium]
MRHIRTIVLCAVVMLAAAQATAFAAAVETYGLIFIIDGARGDAFHDFAVNGYQGRAILPNVKKYFIDQGVWVKKATTVFPTITGTAMPSVLTGCNSGRHGLPSLYFFDRITKRYPVLYVLAEAFDWDKWIAPSVKTIWEYFDGPDDAISFGPALHRGSDSHISILYNLQYKPLEIRSKLQLAWRDLKRKLTGGLPAHLTVVYNGWFDHKEHGNGALGADQIAEYESVDAQVGEAMELFMDTVHERQKAGVTVRYFVALGGDHGQQDIRECVSIDRFVKEQQGARAVDKIWVQVFGQRIKGNTPDDLSTFDLVCASGEGHALLYFPTMRPNGEKIWDARPPLELLRAYPYHGKMLDIPAMAVAERAISFATALDAKTDTVHVFAKGGEAAIDRKDVSGRPMYRYRVLSGNDPFGYAGDARVKHLLDDGYHHSREWQLATLDTNYPDAVVQNYQAFGERNRSPDLFLSAGQYISIGDLVDEGKSKSKHGGLTVDEAWTVVAFNGTDLTPGVVQTARVIDIVPTMLALMGKDYDPDSLDGEAIPSVMAKVQEAQAERLAPGELQAVEKAVEEQMGRLQTTNDEGVFAWASGLAALLKRPGLSAAYVETIRERAYREVAGRADSAARALVQGEVPREFLVRRRPDLPRVAPRAAVRADPTVVQGLTRDLGDKAYKRVFELLEVAFARGTDPRSENGKKALQEIDSLLGVLAALHRSGYPVMLPSFSHETWRNGPNLRYEGLTTDRTPGGASSKALSEFLRIEGARADGLRSVLFDDERARFQVAVGERLQALTRTLEAPAGKAPLDLAALGGSLGPGEVLDTLAQLDGYGRAAALPGVALSAPAPQGPSSPAHDAGRQPEAHGRAVTPPGVAQPAPTPRSSSSAAPDSGRQLDQLYQEMGVR